MAQNFGQALEIAEKLAFLCVDDRQITHLICARLKYDLYDFSRGVLGPFVQEKEQEAGPKHTQKSHIGHILGGHKLDE